MHLTPDILAATWDFLRSLPPFARWKLPEADAVEFHVVRVSHFADHTTYRGPEPLRHIVRVSEDRVEHATTLVKTMAHEMIHAAQAAANTATRAEHNADFHRRALLVGRTLGFDPKEL